MVGTMNRVKHDYKILCMYICFDCVYVLQLIIMINGKEMKLMVLLKNSIMVGHRLVIM